MRISFYLLDGCQHISCAVNELRLEPPGEDVDKLVLESLFEVLKTEAQKEPLILFIRNVEKSILGNFERYIKLETLKDVRLVVIGSHTSDQQKEKGNAGTSSSSKAGNNVTALLDLSFLVSSVSIGSCFCIVRAPLTCCVLVMIAIVILKLLVVGPLTYCAMKFYSSMNTHRV